MKAVRFDRFGGPEVLRLVEVPDPHAGPGEVRVRVRAAGVNASDWARRQGQMGGGLPQYLSYEAAGIVDEVGAGVTDVTAGDRVFGASPSGAAQAEYAVLSLWAHTPEVLDDVHAAAVPVAAETAARALDRLGVEAGSLLLISGASGSVGTAAVQLAVARGAHVIGTGSPATHDLLRSLGARPVAYGAGMARRVRALAPGGVDLALDAAGHSVLPDLVALTGDPGRVVTLADPQGTRQTGVWFSSGEDGRAGYAIAQAARLAQAGQFTIPVGQTFPLAEVARAHRAGQARTTRGKLILLVP